jgi:hypothetical protein
MQQPSVQITDPTITSGASNFMAGVRTASVENNQGKTKSADKMTEAISKTKKA